MSYDQHVEPNDTVFENGLLKIDYAAGIVTVGGSEVHLTPIEYRLLCLLAQNVGKVLTHHYILDKVWENTIETDTQSLRVFMAILRKKIEKNVASQQYIQTHIGVGYRMVRI